MLLIALVAVAGHGLSAAGKARRDRDYRVLRDFERRAAGWLVAVHRAAALHPGVKQIAVPRNQTTRRVFGRARAHKLFYEATYEVAVANDLRPAAAAGTVIVGAAAVWRPGMRLPGWRPEWDWLRRLALCGGGEQCEW